MTITKREAGQAIVLSLQGRVDTITAPELQKALLSEVGKYPELVLDLAGVDYVSSAGLRVLLLGQKSAQKAKGGLVLEHVSEEIMEVLRMTGFSNILEIRS